ncbi:aldolase/citrate lyase family protein [Halobacteriovorax sp. ZH1_bin.1]|uniref:aldolase/citrate lyase family protein n=1 Tax=Halobacteriovorax sp. ZH1_bin.1 TaxID=3157723 RepID=UPI00371C463E
MELMIIENDVEQCKFYDECGVDRIFIDIERIGKKERQGHLDTVISDHQISDIAKIKPHLKESKTLLRINPLYEDSRSEIEEGISAGADIIMLPMFTSPLEVEKFINLINGRAKVSLLLETPAALFRLDDILALPGIHEIHIGLNDLHIALGLDFMLEIYKSPILELVCSKIISAGISLGVGGIAPLDMGMVKGSLVTLEAIRLGSERSILSRAFPKDDKEVFKNEIIRLRKFLKDSRVSEENRNINRELIEEINLALNNFVNP